MKQQIIFHKLIKTINIIEKECMISSYVAVH